MHIHTYLHTYICIYIHRPTLLYIHTYSTVMHAYQHLSVDTLIYVPDWHVASLGNPDRDYTWFLFRPKLFPLVTQSFQLRSLLMAHPSKFYISLKSFFFVRDWAGSASE